MIAPQKRCPTPLHPPRSGAGSPRKADFPPHKWPTLGSNSFVAHRTLGDLYRGRYRAPITKGRLVGESARLYRPEALHCKARDPYKDFEKKDAKSRTSHSAYPCLTPDLPSDAPRALYRASNAEAAPCILLQRPSPAYHSL